MKSKSERERKLYTATPTTNRASESRLVAVVVENTLLLEIWVETHVYSTKEVIHLCGPMKVREHILLLCQPMGNQL